MDLEPAARQLVDLHTALVRSDLKTKVLDQPAQIGEKFFAGDLLLIRGLDRHSCEREPIGAGVKQHLRRIPLDRRADLTGIDLHVIDSGVLERDGELEPDRSRTDDRDVMRLDHVASPSSRNTPTFASIITWCSSPSRSARLWSRLLSW